MNIFPTHSLDSSLADLWPFIETSLVDDGDDGHYGHDDDEEEDDDDDGGNSLPRTHITTSPRKHD